MAFSMNFSKSELTGNSAPVPAGIYTLQFNGFKPKVSKAGDSVNLNAEFSIIQHPEYEGRKIFASLNTKGAFIFPDFVHACDCEMEVVQDEFVGTEAENLTLPGVFDGSDQYPEDPSQWKYMGPLTNATLQVELAETEYQGKKRNEIRMFVCALGGTCSAKHSTNLIRG